MTVDTDSAIAADLAALECEVQAFREAVAAGDPVDLAGLDHRTHALCARIEAVGADDEARKLLPSLRSLASNIDALIENLTRRQNLVPQEKA